MKLVRVKVSKPEHVKEHFKYVKLCHMQEKACIISLMVRTETGGIEHHLSLN